jgi:NTE family protein
VTIGVVLSGGGARGAYEAGVLSSVFRSPRLAAFDVVCGTSVGAFNGAFLAAVAHQPAAGVARLAELWAGLELSKVFRFGLREAADLYRVVLGGRGEIGALDVSPLADLVARIIPWRSLRSNIASGRVRALTVSATHVSTGQTFVFVDRAHDAATPASVGRRGVTRDEAIRPVHILASSAIPVLFPPVRIRGELFCEGGLRLNTPMSPAIRLGADRLLVVAVSTPAGRSASASVKPGWTPGLPFLLGKVLNAFLLDHVVADLGHLEEINEILLDGVRLHGPSFLDRLQLEAIARGEPPRRILRPLVIRPSVDIGRLAGDHMRRNRFRFDRTLGRALLRLLEVGEGEDADLASYLLFDGAFTRELVELGRKDAEVRRDEIESFFLAASQQDTAA